ncbi:winged helix-turn-helix domain-containing protein [Litorilituus sediminis]|uniref:OmpR/PhoB-type domain-containing protein n=1 Tax=Litorilituus sediminis TaxID=718192 RepID=A0A4P6P9D2_9GAMM|nr:winged helix-turn-helix domain-containing protein [Litorilituus sediminis]QBG36202.1 hypothetical protein EMK97_10980 [Litorilituus sediminis]
MKKRQYRLEDYSIDITRNQICKAGSCIALPPKAIAVLEILIKHQGEVVSFDNLMQAVWPDTIVTANTLQRCILQLRKAFADDSKQQRVIKTHAKQGYSLEPACCEVDSTKSKRFISTKKTVFLSLAFILFAVGLILLATWQDGNEQQTDKLVFSTVSAITSSDANEAYGRYSPDGNFVAFLRNIDACYSELWAKDLAQQKEFKLLEKSGVYGQPSWSPDGSKLVFTERNACPEKEQASHHCWSINSVEFKGALAQPQQTTQLLDCNDRYSEAPQWLSDSVISFLRADVDDNMILYTYELDNDDLQRLYQANQDYIYSYAYSTEREQFALLTISATNRHSIKLLSKQGQVLSSYAINLPTGATIYKKLPIAFHASGDFFVTIINQRLFQLWPDGRLQAITVAQRHGLDQPSFHPFQQKMLATEVMADTDIGLVRLTEQAQQELPMSISKQEVIARSNVSDEMASFQGNANMIAFSSKRSGIRQLWRMADGEVTQLSQFEHGVQTKAVVWSPSGAKLAAIADNQVQLISLDKQVESIATEYLVTDILQWPSKDKLLVKAIVQGEETLMLLDLRSLTLQKHDVDSVVWANILPDGDLVYLAANDKVWLVGRDSRQLTKLAEQLERPIMTRQDNMLYGINKQQQLWRYDLKNHQFTVLAQLASNARYVSSVQGDKVLITYMNRFSKELVELY